MCGDILGAAVEMLPAEQIASRFGRVKTFLTNPERPFGCYTDDTQMTLALAWSLVQCGGLVDPEHCAAAYTEFYQEWRGYGKGAKKVMEALKAGASYKDTGIMFIPEGSLANGGAMRIGPVGLAFRNAPHAVLYRAVHDAVMCTHRHAEGIDGAFVQAAAVASLARLALADAPAPEGARPRAGVPRDWDVELRVRCETSFGETVCLAGDWCGWGTETALELQTSDEDYPLWRTRTPVPIVPGRSIEYKYIVRGAAGGAARWEAFEGNRRYAPPGRPPKPRGGEDGADEGPIAVDDGWFGAREEGACPPPSPAPRPEQRAGGTAKGDVEPFRLLESLGALARTEACRGKLAAARAGLERLYGPPGGPPRAAPRLSTSDRAAIELQARFACPLPNTPSPLSGAGQVAKELMGECGLRAAEGVAVALWALCLHWRHPVDCLAAAVGYGGDCDTTAAMAGPPRPRPLPTRPQLSPAQGPCWGRCTGRAALPSGDPRRSLSFRLPPGPAPEAEIS
eukprot:tig00021244_g19583.t1